MSLKRMLALLLAAALLGSMPVLADGDELPAPDDLFLLGDASESGDITLIDVAEEAAAEEEEILYAYEEEASFSVAAMYGADEILSVPGEEAVFSEPAMYAAAQTDGAASSYDPRKNGSLPAVRTQGTWNTCWAVAAVGAAELDGLTSGLLGTSAKNTNLSERHLIYFFAHQADDPLGNSSNDHNINPTFWIRNGGNPVIASMTLASWHGAATEAGTGSSYSGLSTSDSLDSKYAYADVLHLENTYAIDISGTAGRNALKSMIGDHGGAVLCLYFDSAYLFAGSPSQSKAGKTDASVPEDTGAAGDPMDDPATDAQEDTPREPEPTPAPTPMEAVEEGDAHIEEETAAPAQGAEPENGDTSPAEADPTEDPAPESEPEPAEEEETDAAAESGEESSAPADNPTEDAAGETETEPESETETETETGAEPESSVGLDGAAEEALYVDGASGKAADYTVCYYQNVTRTTNHEVIIVGWDDGYPASNFGHSAKGAVPPGNGAWLCRNSHGSGWYGGDGYFWVSYYDASVSASTSGSISGRVTVFDFGPADNFDHNYEYDGAAVLGYVNDSIGGRGVSTTDADSSTRRWYANVFTASGNSSARGTESLKAVSTYTYRAGVSYTAQVYTGLTDPADPTSGTLAAETTGTFPYAGFHTVELPSAVSLQENERYSVVFRVGMAEDKSLFVPACYTSTNWYSTNETLAGQSFVSLDGGDWLDCKDLKNEPNVRIKAYTDDVAAVFPFTDVAASAWYYSDVETSWLKYLVNGMTDTTYDPSATATRAQIVAVLHRLSGNGAPKIADVSFDDVPIGAWYYDDVRWAESLGIITGSDDDGNGVYSFRPNDSITRQEFMTVLYRYAQLQNAATSQTADLSAFSDRGQVGSWAADAVTWSVASGLQKGVADSAGNLTLAPRSKVTRAQLAAFLNRFSEMV